MKPLYFKLFLGMLNKGVKNIQTQTDWEEHLLSIR